MSAEIELSNLSEELRLAWLGSLLALAAADGSVDRRERELIAALFETSGFSAEGHDRLAAWIESPPVFKDTLQDLAPAPLEVRYGFHVGLCDVALADEFLDPAERTALRAARTALALPDGSTEATLAFLSEIHAVRRAGIDDAGAASRIGQAADGLRVSGLPVIAVYFSGSVLALKTELPTSFAALGLELGFVPGASISVLLGAGVKVSMCDSLDGSAPAPEPREGRRRDLERVALAELEETINDLVRKQERLEKLDADDHAVELTELGDREAALRQLVFTRRSALERAE